MHHRETDGASSMHVWQPIATAPSDRVVEIMTFPSLVDADATPRLAIGHDLAASYPTATHWRELSDDIIAAVRESILRKGMSTA